MSVNTPEALLNASPVSFLKALSTRVIANSLPFISLAFYPHNK